MAVAANTTEIAFVTYDPAQKTFGIEISHPVGQEPAALIAALSEIGFVEDDRFAPLPPLDGIQERNLNRRGSGLFGYWTDEEAVTFMAEAERVLAEHGYTNVPRYVGERD